MAYTDERPPLLPRDAIDSISRFLPREWSSLTEDQVTVESITGGYLNTVNLVSRSTESIVEPSQVVVRRSDGGFKRERGKGTPFSTKFEELAVFNESSKIGTSPKLYGMSEELTVQEYFKGHTLTPEDCLDENIRAQIAQAYAKFHTINLPIDKIKYTETIASIKDAYQKLPESKENLKKLLLETCPQLDWDEVLEIDFASEYEWWLKTMDKLGYRTSVSTGDNNYLNVLIADDRKRVTLIDYEMAKYEPRGIDLGGHLFNRVMKWSDKSHKKSGEDILDHQHRRHFVAEYCKESAKYADKVDNYDPNGLDSVDHLLEETDLGILHYPLTRSGRFIGFVERLAQIDKSFIAAAHHMGKTYIKLKDRLLEEHPNWK